MMYKKMSYSLDFRKKVLQVREEEGLSLAEVFVRFGVGIATVFRWTKTLEPCQTRLKPSTKIDTEALRRELSSTPTPINTSVRSALASHKQAYGTL